MEAVTENKDFLDAALAQIQERLTLERVAKHVPIVERVIKEREHLTQVMHRISCVMQKHQLTLMYDESGKTVDGYDPMEAAAECKDALSLLRLTALRFQ